MEEKKKEYSRNTPCIMCGLFCLLFFFAVGCEGCVDG